MTESEELLIEQQLRVESAAVDLNGVPSADALILRAHRGRQRKRAVAGLAVAACAAFVLLAGILRNQSPENGMAGHPADSPSVPLISDDESPSVETLLAVTEAGQWELCVKSGEEQLFISLPPVDPQPRQQQSVRSVPIWQLDAAVQDEIRANWAAAGYAPEIQI